MTGATEDRAEQTAAPADWPTGGHRPIDPPFLHSAAYRTRRMQDAARVLPVLGAILFALPMLWAAGRSGSTVRSGVYLFAVWAVLAICAGLLSRRLARSTDLPADPTDRGP